MRKTESPLRTKILRVVCVMALAIFAVPALLGLALAVSISHEQDRLSAPAQEALQAVGMKPYAAWNALTFPGAAAFHLFKYDNHVDNTDLPAALMAEAATTEGWTIAPVTADEYAAQIPQEMAFLLPDANLIFDASYRQGDTAAYFDQESGLMICLRPEAEVEPLPLRLEAIGVSQFVYGYRMDTHGGFHGDGITFLAFTLPEGLRARIEDELAPEAGWHTGSIPQAEYTLLHKDCFYDVPDLFPGKEIVFDRWYYADDYARQYPDEEIRRWSADRFPTAMQATGAGCSGNWSIGLYDEDSGLFIFYEFDS